MPSLFGPAEEYDIPLRPRDLSNVRRPDVRMSNLPKSRREKDSTLLDPRTADTLMIKNVLKLIVNPCVLHPYISQHFRNRINL